MKSSATAKTLILRSPIARSVRGVSLIEMMIAVTIVAILAVLGIPSYQVWIQNTQIRNAAEAVTNGLQRARGEAVARNANVTFVLGADSSWTLSANGAVFETRPASDGSLNVTRTVLPAGATTLTFSNFGVITTNGDGSAPLTQVDFDSALLSAADSRDLRVTIGVGGNAKMCDPNLTTGTSPLAC